MKDYTEKIKIKFWYNQTKQLNDEELDIANKQVNDDIEIRGIPEWIAIYYAYVHIINLRKRAKIYV